MTSQIADTRQRVDGWVARGRTLEEPRPGSDLADDDKTWPFLRASEIARLALVAASDHLQLVGESVDRKRLYASALHTPLRGALVGGATAVWVVAPDDAHERRQRALRIATEWYQHKADYDGMLLPVCPPELRHRLTDEIGHSIKRGAECRLLWQSTDTLTATERPKDTKVIHWVADTLYPGEPAKALRVKAQWADMSGGTHAVGWQLLFHRTAPMTPTPDGLRKATVVNEIEHLLEPYLVAYSVVRRGWLLFDQRCSKP